MCFQLSRAINNRPEEHFVISNLGHFQSRVILVGNLNQAYLSNHQLFQSQKRICPTKHIFQNNDGVNM